MGSKLSYDKFYVVIFLSLFFSSVYSGFVAEDFKIRGEAGEKETGKSDVQKKRPVSFLEGMPTFHTRDFSGPGGPGGIVVWLLAYSGGYIAYRILGNAESKRNQAIIGVSALATVVVPVIILFMASSQNKKEFPINSIASTRNVLGNRGMLPYLTL